MTDEEIIEGLISRDNYVTNYFFKKYNPLFLNAISLIFNYKVDKDECLNELYLYLMKDEAMKLKQFEGRSTLGGWLKIVVIRFFKDLRDRKIMIDNSSQAPLYEQNDVDFDDSESRTATVDIENLLSLIKNERYVMVIRALVINEEDPRQLAKFMCITVDNLYNIKKRALVALAKAAINDRNKYGNKK